VLLAALPAAARTARFSACLVTAAGVEGPGGTSLDRSAVLGLQQAEQAGVAGRVLVSRSPAEYARNLRACARRHAGLTIGVGYDMADAMDAVATAFAGQRFAIVDVDVATLTHRPANVTGLLFREQQAGYLVGYAAGLWAKAHGGKAIGSVGGIKIPPVDGYIAGYEFGAKRADPGLKLLNGYSDDFVAQGACRKQALDQIAQGSVVEFQVAGRCGLGVLEAAHEKNVFGIGVDADQARLGPWVMTSALKRADVAVDDAILRARSGRLRGGTNAEYGAGVGGVGYGTWSPRVPARIRAAVARQLALLRAGKIRDIPTTLG
jgi:basic membrane protein A